MPSRERGSMPLALLTATCLLTACGEPDYIRVVVQGSNPDVTATPVAIEVSIYGDGKSARYSYTDQLKKRAAGSSNLPSSDSVIEIGEDAPDSVVLRSRVQGPFDWGADTRLSLPGKGRDIVLSLAVGERQVAQKVRFAGDWATSAPFQSGLVFAWPDETGILTTHMPEPDQNVSGFTKEPPLSADTGASRVRIAARPDSSSFGSMLYAVTWRRGDGALELAVGTPQGTAPRVEVETGDDIHAACSSTPASSEDGVVVTLQGGVLRLRAFHVDGSGSAPAVTLGASREVLTGVESLERVVPVANAYVVALRTQEGSKLVKASLATDAPANVVSVDREIRAIARSFDGSRLFLALADSTGRLSTESRFAGDLVVAEQSGVLAKLPFLAAQPRAQVSMAECALVWPELRDDGSDSVDLRVQRLDSSGLPVGPSHIVNVDVEGNHYAPTAVCPSPLRAYVAFYAESISDPLSGKLMVRRAPFSLSTVTP